MSPNTNTTDSIAILNNTPSLADLGIDLSQLKPKPLSPDQINWPKSQRKRRKNARRAFANGVKTAFN